MQLLLDTHAFIWWLAGDRRLTERAQAAIADDTNEVFVSAATAWEIATKRRIGKLSGFSAASFDVERAVAEQGFSALPIGLQHGRFAGDMPGAHRDPFDRMLIAQAFLEKLLLVSNETIFDAFGVHRLW